MLTFCIRLPGKYLVLVNHLCRCLLNSFTLVPLIMFSSEKIVSSRSLSLYILRTLIFARAKFAHFARIFIREWTTVNILVGDNFLTITWHKIKKTIQSTMQCNNRRVFLLKNNSSGVFILPDVNFIMFLAFCQVSDTLAIAVSSITWSFLGKHFLK